MWNEWVKGEGAAKKEEQVPSSVQPADAMKRNIILIIKTEQNEDQVLIELKQWSNLLPRAMVITQAKKNAAEWICLELSKKGWKEEGKEAAGR